METTSDISQPRRLARPRSGRWLAGVCAGLGEYFELSPAIYRIAFVALTLAGGAGILLYLAAWLVMPVDGEEESIASAFVKEHRDRPRRLVGLALIAFVAVVVLSSANVWPSAGGLWFAAALVIGAIVVWRLGARGRIIVASLLVLLALAFAALALAVSVPFSAGAGNRTYEPASVTDVHSRYELGIGNLRLDFSHVTLPRGETFVKAKLGIGNLRVVVPANATVDANGRAQAGNVRVLGQDDNGTHVHTHVVDRTGTGRVLVLDARVGLGNVEVERG
jgi:phage shock protein PspC (stress-responsive transcriptional regulator)